MPLNLIGGALGVGVIDVDRGSDDVRREDVCRQRGQRGLDELFDLVLQMEPDMRA